jgi:hypothetical protein
MEKLRDPSHVRALLLDELTELFAQTNLELTKTVFYRQRMSLELLLKGSFPNPGDEDRVRQIILDDVGKNALGLGAQQVDDDICFDYPIAALVGKKRSSTVKPLPEGSNA